MNYVDSFWAFFDHLLPSVDKKWTFLDYLPTYLPLLVIMGPNYIRSRM